METAQAGDGGVGALPVAETERCMAKRAFNHAVTGQPPSAWLLGGLTVHFVKKHYLQCNTGEVGKTFSQLGVLHVSVGGISKVLHPHTKLSQSGLYFV